VQNVTFLVTAEISSIYYLFISLALFWYIRDAYVHKHDTGCIINCTICNLFEKLSFLVDVNSMLYLFVILCNNAVLIINLIEEK